MYDRTAPAATAASTPANRLARPLLNAAVIVLVLGVLPVAWDAAPVWQVLGPLVAAAVTLHTARLVWQEVFSTDPRHLGTSA